MSFEHEVRVEPWTAIEVGFCFAAGALLALGVGLALAGIVGRDLEVIAAEGGWR